MKKKIASLTLAAVALAAVAGPMDVALSIERHYNNQLIIIVHRPGILQKLSGNEWVFVAGFPNVPNYYVVTNSEQMAIYRLLNSK